MAKIMLDDVVEGVVGFLFHLFVEIICFYTGEIILYVITFGRKKPRWDYYSDASPSKWIILTEVSTWIGIIFWILVAFYFARSLA
jgi:hypothetical protein